MGATAGWVREPVTGSGPWRWLISAALLKSTGDPALDKEALVMVERAQPFAPPPGEVSDDNLTMRVQIVFAPKPVSGTMQDVGPEGRELRAKLNSICRGC